MDWTSTPEDIFRLKILLTTLTIVIQGLSEKVTVQIS